MLYGTTAEIHFATKTFRMLTDESVLRDYYTIEIRWRTTFPFCFDLFNAILRLRIVNVNCILRIRWPRSGVFGNLVLTCRKINSRKSEQQLKIISYVNCDLRILKWIIIIYRNFYWYYFGSVWMWQTLSVNVVFVCARISAVIPCKKEKKNTKNRFDVHRIRLGRWTYDCMVAHLTHTPKRSSLSLPFNRIYFFGGIVFSVFSGFSLFEYRDRMWRVSFHILVLLYLLRRAQTKRIKLLN